MTSADPTGINRMLADAASMLSRYQAGTSAVQSTEAEGTGEAAEGRITVRAAAPGRLTSLYFDPRVLRMDSESLAEEVMSAVNSALAELRGQSAATTDFSTLSEQLKEVQENASRQLASFTDALVDAQQRIAAQGGK